MKKLKNIFIFLFYISVTSLVCQGVATSFLKDGSSVKKQLTSNTSNPAEEEEDGHVKIEEKDGVLALENSLDYDLNFSFLKINWGTIDLKTSSCRIQINTPPPKLA